MSIPDWKLERLALGELPDGERQALKARLAADEALAKETAARLAALREDDRATLEQHRPSDVARVLRARAELQMRKRRLALSVALVPVMAMGLLVAVQQEESALPEPLAEVTRTKGLVPHLVVHRKTKDASEILADHAPARRGDVLQLSYVPAGRPHGMVVSIDGRGSVTLHYPTSPRHATTLSREAEVALPSAYELDDAPDFERFFFVTSDQPLDVARVLAAARRLTAAQPESAPLPLDNTTEQVSVLIRKVL
jgi:hypothetical protein